MMSVAVAAGAVFEPGRPTFLFDDVYRRDHANHIPNYDVAPDGRFLMVQSEEEAANLHVVLNWTSELFQLAEPVLDEYDLPGCLARRRA